MTNIAYSCTSSIPGKLHFWLLPLLLAIILLGCGATDPKDNTPPTITATLPTSDADEVDVETDIVVTFSEAVNASTVTQATLYVEGYVSDDITVSGSTARLALPGSLAYDTEHEVVVRGVKDRAGNAMRAEYRWSFQTESNPLLLAPQVIATVPSSGANGVDATAPVTVTFSKIMDAVSFDDTSIRLDNGTTGTVVMVDSTATFTPDDTLLFLTTYTATVDSTVRDAFGNDMTSDHVWSFTTGPDPMIPVAEIISPVYGNIIGDSVLIEIDTDHPVGVTLVEFYIDGVHVIDADDSVAPFEYAWDASDLVIGSIHAISAVAHETGGRVGYSDTSQVIFQWEQLLAANDHQDDWPVDIRNVYYRSTDSLLEFRFVMWEDWSDDPVNDTALDVGIYLDTDLSATTGRTYFPDVQHLLNGIGADYMMIVGLHGLDALRKYNNQSNGWETVYDPTGFEYINLPPDTNVFEVGLRWTDIGSPSNVRMLAINVLLVDMQGAFLPDWVPNEGEGYLLLSNQDRYVGEGYVEPTAKRARLEFNRASKYDDPFSIARSKQH